MCCSELTRIKTTQAEACATRLGIRHEGDVEMPEVMKTLFLNPPSYEGFDGGAGARSNAEPVRGAAPVTGNELAGAEAAGAPPFTGGNGDALVGAA